MKKGLLALGISLACLMLLAGLAANTSRAELLLTPTPVPASSPLTGRIVYATYPGEGENYDSEVFVMDLATREVMQLTDDANAANYTPLWSPDGEHILYIHDDGTRSLVIIDADGANRVRVTPDDILDVADFPLSWSPDGHYILFAGPDLEGDIYTVYTARADGSDVVRVPLEDISDFWIYPFSCWTLDNRLLVLQHGGIYRMNPDGSDPELLLENPLLSWGYFFLTPGGQLAAVMSAPDEISDRPFWLWLIDLETGEQTPLAGLPRGAGLSDLSWSPDGRWLAVSVQVMSGSTDEWHTTTLLLDLQAEGRDWRDLNFSDSVWSPDARFLAYPAQVEDGSYQIFAVSPEEGSVPIQLTTDGGSQPDWHE